MYYETNSERTRASVSSASLFEQASRRIAGGFSDSVPGGHTSGACPVFIDRALGSHIWDVDYTAMIDLICSYGSVLRGHANSETIIALQSAAIDGFCYSLPHRSESELADLICAGFGSVDKLKFTNSAAESAILAIRLARAYTGRDMILKIDNCCLVDDDIMPRQTDDGYDLSALPQGMIKGSGIPYSASSLILRAQYNDSDQLASIFRTMGSRIAAVILEPVMTHAGLIPPKPGYLEEVGLITRQAGALLIFDESITAQRIAAGGAQEFYRVDADLTVLDGVIGGGLPLSAVGGRAELLDQIYPQGEVWEAGFTRISTLSVAAGLTTLKYTADNPEIFAALAKKAECLGDAFEQAAATDGLVSKLPVAVQRCGSLISVFFGRTSVINSRQAYASDSRLYDIFRSQMLAHAILLPPTMFSPWYISTAHSAADIIVIARAIRESLSATARLAADSGWKTGGSQ